MYAIVLQEKRSFFSKNSDNEFTPRILRVPEYSRRVRPSGESSRNRFYEVHFGQKLFEVNFILYIVLTILNKKLP
jgi:hypothetical protein